MFLPRLSWSNWTAVLRKRRPGVAPADIPGLGGIDLKLEEETVGGSKRPRVLFIDHTAKLGGGEIALRDLILALDRSKLDLSVLLLEDGPLADQLRPYVRVEIIPLQASASAVRKDDLGLGSVLRFRQIYAIASCVFRVASFISDHHADIVHTNSLKSDLIGGVAARLAGRKVIWHIRDRIAADYLPPLVVRGFRTLLKIIPTLSIAVSDAVLSTLSSGHVAQGRRRAVVIHDGVAPETLAPLTAELPGSSDKSDPRIVGLIGRICPWKGQHIFIRAAARVHAEFPNVQFQIIGSPLFGELEYEQELRRQSVELGLESVLTFTGFVDDVPERLARLEVLVHASVIPEPFGLVVVEAMARAKPVVATRGGGVLETVVDGETGLLIPMNDAPAMAAAVCKLLGSPAEAASMGVRGRRRVEQAFTVNHTAVKVEAVYRQLWQHSTGTA